MPSTSRSVSERAAVLPANACPHRYMVKHPGGAAVFTNKLGSDLTERFFFVHTAFGFTHLEKLAVAAVVDACDVAADEK
eukprot:m.130953 g.130953  ORF g.130953 m.130953 type:complete len:79 (+) comp22393_c0_seq1:298-534(+)